MKVDMKKAEALAEVLVECYGKTTEKSRELTVNAFGDRDNLQMMAFATWVSVKCGHLDHQVCNLYAKAVDLGVRIGMAQKNGDEVEEEETSDWEDEEKRRMLIMSSYLFKRLASCYILEDVRLICMGEVPTPYWLREEIKAEKVGKSERSSGC